MLKSYNFWIRLVAVLVLLLRIVGAEFGFSVDSGLIIDLATAIASVLVVLGVIQVPVEKCAVVDDAGIENENNKLIGGSVVKTFEQIKEDIIVVKEKILSNLTGEESVMGEIAVILDGIIAPDEVAEMKNEVQSNNDFNNLVLTDDGGNVVVGDESFELNTVCETESGAMEEGLNTKGVDEAENDIIKPEIDSLKIMASEESQCASIPEIDKDKFNEVVRRKMAQMLEKELDTILAEVMG